MGAEPGVTRVIEINILNSDGLPELDIVKTGECW
jgi:hypothetical protein